MKHARLVCNQREKFQCAECRKLTSNGFQLIDGGETKFVCKDCYENFEIRYPIKGKSIKHLLPADLIFSDGYDPEVSLGTERSEEEEHSDIGYIGELVPDGNGGWREPTPEELRAMNEPPAPEPAHTTAPDELSEVTVKYRFTTDNKLQVILPRKCRIDGNTYELIVTTEE